MKSVKFKRILCFALALLFCAGVSVMPTAKKAEYIEPDVRVGMYVAAPILDTRLFSSNNKSQNGFEIGYTSGDSFVKLFSISQGSIIVLPQVNASVNGSEAYPDANGSIGAYSAVLGRFTSHAAALKAASAKTSADKA